MNITDVMLAARKPRADVVQFLLSVGLLQSERGVSGVVSLDEVVREYLCFGPEHTARYPFPVAEDLASGLVWLQRNGYLFLAGDDALTLNRAQGFGKTKYSTRMLCMAIEAAMARSEATPAVTL